MQTATDKSPNPIDTESQNTSSVWGQLFQNFRTGKEYRHAFVEEKVRTSIAAQIKAIREHQRMKQPDFAEKLHKSQSWVSRLEDPNQAAPTIPSLLQVAEAFDVDLEVRFDRFSELLDRMDQMAEGSLQVPNFKEELPDLERKFADKEQQNRRLAPMPPQGTKQRSNLVFVEFRGSREDLAGFGPICAQYDLGRAQLVAGGGGR